MNAVKADMCQRRLDLSVLKRKLALEPDANACGLFALLKTYSKTSPTEHVQCFPQSPFNFTGVVTDVNTCGHVTIDNYYTSNAEQCSQDLPKRAQYTNGDSNVKALAKEDSQRPDVSRDPRLWLRTQTI